MPIFALLVLSVITMSARLSVEQNEREANGRAAEYARQGHDEAQLRCAVLVSGPKRQNCLREVERTAREQQRREYEIEADRDSAVWNEAMGEAAAVAGVISIMTFILVFVTYEAQVFAAKHAREQFLHAREDAASAAKATERTIKASNKTATAAARQVAISEETARRELRAYVDVSKAELKERDGRNALWVSFTNFGRTPAVNVSVFSDVHLMTWPLGEIPDAKTLHNAGNTMPPGHPRRYGIGFNPDEWSKMLRNEASFVIPLKVTYDTLDLKFEEFKSCLIVSLSEVQLGEARNFNAYWDRKPRPGT